MLHGTSVHVSIKERLTCCPGLYPSVRKTQASTWDNTGTGAKPLRSGLIHGAQIHIAPSNRARCYAECLLSGLGPAWGKGAVWPKGNLVK